MNPPHCPICPGDGRPRWRRVTDYISGQQFDIRQCERCGLLFTDPLPPTAHIDDYYGPRYRGNRHGVTAGFRTRRRVAEVRWIFPPGFTGRILDIGCGQGDFARAMRKAGWDVAATELDKQVLAELREEGIDARPPHGAEFSEPFDAVTLWHVLEHSDDPLGLIGQVATWLRPGGFVFVGVPNAASPQARLFGRHWLAWDVPRHRVHFTAATLRRLLQSAGLDVVRESRLAIEYDLMGIVQSALNMCTRRPNVLFERLTSGQKQAVTQDLIVSVAAAPVLAGPALYLCLLEAVTLGSGSISVIGRKPL